MSKKQYMVLNLPRSSARIFRVVVLGFGVGNVVRFLRRKRRTRSRVKVARFIQMNSAPNPGITWILSVVKRTSSNLGADRDMLQIARLRLIQGFALIAALFSLGLFLVRPDIERYLEQNLPGHHMTDAFRGLNGILAIFILFVSATTLLMMTIEKRRHYVMLIPLLFGPTACLVGWFLTENLNDPNWFLLLAPTTIGMLVSCAVTFVLLVATRKTTVQSIWR